MITFISLSGHFAVAYLHLLLLSRFFSQRRDNKFVHLFWVLMVISFLLHAIYGLNYLAILFSQKELIKYLVVAGYWLLTFYPAILSTLFLGDLTEPPNKPNFLSPYLIGISNNTKRLFYICIGISIAIILVTVVRDLQSKESEYSFGNEYALAYLLVFATLWVLMFASGYRPAKRNEQINKPIFGYVLAIVVFSILSLASYLFELGKAWSIVPIVSTTAVSLSFCWYRLRTQFMDVILSQFLRIIALITIVVGLGQLLDTMEKQKFTHNVELLVLLLFVLIFSIIYNWLNTQLKALWYPPITTLSLVHTELPPLLHECLNRKDAIRKTEDYLSELFNTQVTINREGDNTIQTLHVEGDPSLVISLDYMRKWMPWFSEALNWVKIAGLYLQSHLKVLETLQRDHEGKLRVQTFKGHAAKAELIALRAQIRPHFLFNCLNSIHTFITSDPPLAETMIEKLAELMRGVLKMSDTDTFQLKRELDLVRNYITIEKIRHGDHLNYNINIQDGCEELSVPSFSIQPLVENAIKFAVDTQLEPAQIDINIWKTDKLLMLEVKDNGLGLLDAPSNGLGMAMNNIESRLKHLYGDQGKLTLKNLQDAGAVATVIIPLNT